MSVSRIRALSLIEVMSSQVIVIILITGLVGLLTAMTKKINSETNASDAQVRLRQASHLLLRDTQGIGGDAALAGDLVAVTDNVTNAATADVGTDVLTVFKRDESVCNGGMGVTFASGSRVSVNGTCPIAGAGCSVSELSSRRVALKNGGKALELTPVTPASSPCSIDFAGSVNAAAVAAYNTSYKTACETGTTDASPTTGSCATTAAAIANLQPTQALVGSSFTYRVRNQKLERSLNGGAFEVVLDDVLDLQVERIFDSDGDGAIEAVNERGEVEIVTASTGAEPTSATPATFLGLRIGIVTFGRAPEGMEMRPPTLLSNHNLSGAPTGYRYRGTFVFAAARNRAVT